MVSFPVSMSLSVPSGTTAISASMKAALISSVAGTMTGVRPRDVSVMRIVFSTSTRMLNTDFLDESEGAIALAIADAPGQLRDLGEQRPLATTTAAVTLTVTVALVRLGVSSASVGFSSLSNQLTAAVNNGFLSASLASSGISVTSFQLSSFSLTTIISPSSAPTAAPTVLAIVPSVSDITVVGTARTNITLQITLVGGDSLGGTLYCVALRNGTFPTSIGGVKSSSFDSAASRGSLSAIPASSTYPLVLSMAIGSLNALQTYAIFCYAENSLGTGNSLPAVISTKITVTTACCIAISFVNAPLFVYGVVTKNNLAVPSSYLFTYTLFAAPSTSLKVVPALYSNGALSTAVVSVAPSITFTSASVLTGSFYLSASAVTTGSYTLSLTVSGSSAADYSTSETTVTVLSSFSLIPAPKLSSGQFSDSGQAVVMTFDSPTDKAGILTATWPCSRIFTFAGASVSTCTWLSAATVSVSFPVISSGSGASAAQYVQIGDSVTLQGGLLRAYCTATASSCLLNSAAASASVPARAPNNPASPTVIVNAPISLGACTNLSVDATGSYGNGGRPYTSVLWTVSAVTLDTVRDVSAIQSYLNAYSTANQVDNPITIAGSRLFEASYTISLALTNFLGLTASRTIFLAVNSDPNLPVLTIIGPSYQTTTASIPLTILSTASLSSCASKTAVVKYAWTIQGVSIVTSLQSTSLDPSRFLLPAYLLTVDNTYIITISAIAGLVSTSASVKLYVTSGPVTAAVVGGYVRSAPIDQILVLDASISSDANVLTSTLLYQVTHCPSSPAILVLLFANYLYFTLLRLFSLTYPFF